MKEIEISPGPDHYLKKSFIDENNNLKKGFTCRSKVKDLIAQ